MSDYVFDTEALIGYFHNEPGADAVRTHLDAVTAGTSTGTIAHATAVEIADKTARLETGDPSNRTPGESHLAAGYRAVRILQGFGCTIECPSWRLVSKIKAPGGLSLGDAYAAALAVERDATLVAGGDTDFTDLPVQVAIDRIRDGHD